MFRKFFSPQYMSHKLTNGEGPSTSIVIEVGYILTLNCVKLLSYNIGTQFII